jgi:hypothetical protein
VEVIRLVQDNLNTHLPGSLYDTFERDEARRLLRKLRCMPLTRTSFTRRKQVTPQNRSAAEATILKYFGERNIALRAIFGENRSRYGAD